MIGCGGWSAVSDELWRRPCWYESTMISHGRAGHQGTFLEGQSLVILRILDRDMVCGWYSWIQAWHDILLHWISYPSRVTTSQVQPGPIAAASGHLCCGWLGTGGNRQRKACSVYSGPRQLGTRWWVRERAWVQHCSLGDYEFNLFIPGADSITEHWLWATREEGFNPFQCDTLNPVVF